MVFVNFVAVGCYEKKNSDNLLLKFWADRCCNGSDHVKKSSDVGVSLSSFTIDTISARHNGQCCNCDAHVIQKPLKWNGLLLKSFSLV